MKDFLHIKFWQIYRISKIKNLFELTITKYRKIELKLPEDVPYLLCRLFKVCYSWNPVDRPSFADMAEYPYCLQPNHELEDEFYTMPDEEYEIRLKKWREEVCQNDVKNVEIIRDSTR
jgi:hypothetical protein